MFPIFQRRSAIAERIRLREEWSELKGRVSQPNVRQKNNILTKNQTNMRTATEVKNVVNTDRSRKVASSNYCNNVL